MAVSRPSVVPPRTFSMAFCTRERPDATSVGPTLGLATVSISVAVSPKSLTQLTGPAPAGRPETIWVTRLPMSWNCSTVFYVVMQVTSTTATLSWVVVSNS